MDIFKNKLIFDFDTNQNILNAISIIDSFKSKWQVLVKKENIYLKELKYIATIESIGSSTRIEGSVLNDSEIKELIKNIKITKLVSRDQQEVMGYYETLDFIYENYLEIQLTQNHIFQLHQNLLKYSDKDVRHRGHYKNLSNNVIANYPDGVQKVIFNTTEPFLVEKEMTDLLDWINQQIESVEIHPLVVIGLFVYEFLSIHPFQDGNGRLSRLLTNLLLLKLDYKFIQYISFENHIEMKKKEYYEALMDGQKNRYTEIEKAEKWILFFLNSILGIIDKLIMKYEEFKSKGAYLNERQKLIKDFILLSQPVKLGDISKEFNHISVNTLKKDLQYLKQENEIESIGRNRGTVYFISSK